jgi:uncharacterized RDD family membrane protein YckC
MNTNYAGFWLRFVAVIIDYIIIYCVQAFLIVPFLAIVGINFASNIANADTMSEGEIAGSIISFVAALSGLIFLLYVILILYYTLMESSKYQGTVGKMALGLKVTDLDGNKLDFGKAFIRNLCKLISGFIFYVGYIMAGFTDKKQALHDMIASTLVVKKS